MQPLGVHVGGGGHATREIQTIFQGESVGKLTFREAISPATLAQKTQINNFTRGFFYSIRTELSYKAKQFFS